MGRSSTGMPKYTMIVPRSHYNNLSRVIYDPQQHIIAYSESNQDSTIHSIKEIKEEDNDGYKSDEEDEIPKHPRKRSKFALLK